MRFYVGLGILFKYFNGNINYYIFPIFTTKTLIFL